nr:1661_t:CDS:2 [Entrophospora candida]
MNVMYLDASKDLLPNLNSRSINLGFIKIGLNNMDIKIQSLEMLSQGGMALILFLSD